MKVFRFLATALITTTLLTVGTFAQKTTAGTREKAQMITSDRLADETRNSKDDISSARGPEAVNAGTYAFATVSATPEDMSSGTTQLIAASQDDTASALTAIPFTFRFDGVNQTQFSVNANGLLSLGPVVVNNAASGRTNNFATTTDNPKMSAYWDDLCTSATGKVHYKVVGSPGSRRLVVEWQNVVTFGTVACGTTVIGSVQIWLHEGTGVIQMVSTGMGVNDNLQTGYSVGIGSSSTSFASVTTSDNSVSYAASSNANIAAIAAGVSYTFSPNVPVQPTTMNFSAVSQTGMTVSWTDNATNETGYVLSRSTDGINFTQIATPAANATSYIDSGLFPGTNYTYRLFALSEGAQSANLEGSQGTSPAGNISSTGSGGLWSAPATWAGGVVPAAGDNVTIIDGTTVTIDTAAVALSVRVGTNAPRSNKGAVPEGANAVLRFDSAAAQSLTVGGDVFIDASDVLGSATTGTVTTHNLSVGGNLTNIGILDLSTNGDTAGANLTFTGASNATFSGAGSITDIRTITMNKGASATNVLDVTVSNFTVQGSTTDSATSAYLTLTNGTFKISGTFTGSHRTFNAASYTIPGTAGFWLNNTNYTVVAQTGNATVNGLLQVTAGNYNVGTAVDNSVGFGIGSRITVEGGAINVAGRFGVAVAATTTLNYTQSNGVINTCMVGSTSTTVACFDLGTSAAATVVYNITGGNITVLQASTAASGPRDYRLQSGPTGTGAANVTGGTVQFGSPSTTGGVQAFDGAGVFPNVVIDGTSGANSVTLLAPVTWNNLTLNLTIQPNTTFNVGSNVFLFGGTNLTNNGTLTANGAAARFIFFSTLPTTYTGSGVTTGTTTSLENQTPSLTMTNANNVIIRRLIVFVGNIIGASKLTLGAGDATVNVMQFGNTTTPTIAGTLDSAPTFNLGAGGQTISYLRTGNIRTLGPEINPARTLVNFTYDNNDPATDELNVAGGDLTITGVMTLTNGEIKTGANKITHNGTVARTLGLINGTLNRNYTATGSYTYHVGTGNYSPMAATVSTLTTNPSQLSVTSADGPLAGLDPANSVAHKWTLAEVGDLTATITFTYNNADVVGDENTYQLWNGATQIVSAIMTPGSNTASASTVTDFNGTWGIGAAGGPALPGSISGRILTSDGRPIRNTRVELTGGSLPGILISQTGSLGYYNFPDLPAGNYTVTVNGKRFTFSPNSAPAVVNGDVIIDFFAQPGFGVRQ